MKLSNVITCLISLLVSGCTALPEKNANPRAGLEEKDDLLSMKQGAVLLSASSQWDNVSLSAFHLFDDCSNTKWSSGDGKALNNVFDVELQNPCRISDVVIDNAGSPYTFPKLHVKTVRVLASETSPDSGYEQLAETVADVKSITRITFDQKVAARPFKWLRFILVDNWGEKVATESFGIQAYGTRVVDSADNNAPGFKGGVYAGDWSPLKFVTDGNVLFGIACKPNKDDEGMLGSVQGNQARVFFPSGGNPGVALLTQSARGEVVNASNYCQLDPRLATSNMFALLKREKSPSCNGEPNKSIEGLISKYFERYHKALLYGIDFKPDSAELTPESDVTLKAVAAVLDKQPGLRLSVEAHNGWTDSNPIKNIALDYHDDSLPAHQKLSEARAQAVVDWLCNHKVQRSRLQSKGWGKDKPIWAGIIETPRQSLILNRRIELIPVVEEKAVNRAVKSLTKGLVDLTKQGKKI